MWQHATYLWLQASALLVVPFTFQRPSGSKCASWINARPESVTCDLIWSAHGPMDPMGLWVTNLTTICLMGLLGKPSCLMGKSTINGDLMGCNGIYHLVVIDSSPWKDPSFLIGKPSISMGHGFHGELLNNQRVIWISFMFCYRMEDHYLDVRTVRIMEYYYRILYMSVDFTICLCQHICQKGHFLRTTISDNASSTFFFARDSAVEPTRAQNGYALGLFEITTDHNRW